MWVKNRYTKWNFDKWSQKLRPVVPGGLILTHTHTKLNVGLHLVRDGRRTRRTVRESSNESCFFLRFFQGEET